MSVESQGVDIHCFLVSTCSRGDSSMLKGKTGDTRCKNSVILEYGSQATGEVLRDKSKMSEGGLSL